MNEESKKISEQIKKDMLQTCSSIIAADISKYYKWEQGSMTIKSSDSLSTGDLTAVKEVKFKEIEYTGKNPRTVREQSIELYDKCEAMKIMCRLLENDEPGLSDKLNSVVGNVVQL